METFGADVRRWLETNCPKSMRTPMPQDEMPAGGRRARWRNADSQRWLERMAERGWTVPTWPKTYGGGGLTKDENLALWAELERINARPAHVGMGISMIGPALLEYGNEEQKREHLPKIARGEIAWCQGYSEPNAGSDLASLKTRADADGDEFVINGSKIWTSGADQADWIYCLVRTDFSVSKHDGITFLLFDMASPGVTVNPVKLISGFSPFCQTFFDNVRVPKRNVVGQVNHGWTIAKRLLQYERTSIGGIGGGWQRVATLDEIAKRYVGETHDGRIADAALRDGILEQRMNDRCFALTSKRSLEESKSGRAPEAVSSFFKYYGTEQNKRRFEIMLAAMGTQMLGWEGPAFEADELAATRAWLRSKGNSIEGGTSEVQLNIIAKRVLGLPD